MLLQMQLLSETWFGYKLYCRLAVSQLGIACSMHQVYIC